MTDFLLFPYPVDCEDCGAGKGQPCIEGCPNLDGYDWDEHYNSQWEHDCVIQETPDGMGCATCLYC